MSGPEARSVLEGHLVPGYRGGPPVPGVTLVECRRDAVEVRARRGRAEAVRERLGPGAYEIAPGAFFVSTPPQKPSALAAELARELADSASVVDISSGLVALRLGGRRARQTLAKGCRLDLHSSAFAAGEAARTIIAQVPTLLIQVDDEPHFELFVPTTLARSFADHLLHAAAEFGCVILAPEGKARS